MPIDAESLELQKVLSEMLQKPHSGVNEIIRRLFPEKHITEHAEIYSCVQRVFEKVIETSMEKGGPKLIHRLRFCWQILRTADKTIKKRGKSIPDIVSFENARSVFGGILPVSKIQDCVVQSICSLLRLEENGGFLKHYYDFLMATKTRRLTLPIGGKESSGVPLNLRRIIWWIIRRNRFMYVEPSGENGVRIHFPYLSDAIRGDLSKWCNPSEVSATAGLSEGIEEEINQWLAYSCLDGDHFPETLEERFEIATAFVSDNELKNKVYVSSAPVPPHLEERLVELNAELSRYVAENQSLEEEIKSLRVQLAAKQKEEHPSKDHLVEKEDHAGGIKETQDFLKRIDSKYSLEVLRAVQLGEDHSITIKNFIAHFFYALRKTGLQNYPDAVEFDLGYEESNLYECVGFQVEPGSKKRVKVEKKGWALCRGDQMLTIRKAVVRLSS